MGRKNRLSKKTLQEDRDAFAALKNLADYTPSNSAYSVSNVTASFDTMNNKQTIAVQKKAEADGASDDATDSERDFHNMMLGVKTQVEAQYGSDSNEYQSLGLKKKSEYSRGGRRGSSKNNGENNQ